VGAAACLLLPRPPHQVAPSAVGGVRHALGTIPLVAAGRHWGLVRVVRACQVAAGRREALLLLAASMERLVASEAFLEAPRKGLLLVGEQAASLAAVGPWGS
jgi:hypothetical protein